MSAASVIWRCGDAATLHASRTSVSPWYASLPAGRGAIILPARARGSSCSAAPARRSPLRPRPGAHLNDSCACASRFACSARSSCSAHRSSRLSNEHSARLMGCTRAGTTAAWLSLHWQQAQQHPANLMHDGLAACAGAAHLAWGNTGQGSGLLCAAGASLRKRTRCSSSVAPGKLSSRLRRVVISASPAGLSASLEMRCSTEKPRVRTCTRGSALRLRSLPAADGLLEAWSRTAWHARRGAQRQVTKRPPPHETRFACFL